jgi:hypothetical protein
MMLFVWALMLSGAAAGRSDQDAADAGANPIRKVVTLLQDMQKELEAEGAKDKELYDKFMCFCSNGKEELQKTAADSKSSAETLKSQYEEGTAEKAGLEQDLIKHKSDLAGATADLGKATSLRTKESSEYDADLSDQETNFGSISGAIPALEKGLGASSLIQASGNDKTKLKRIIQSSQVISSMEKSDVMAFLENSQSSMSPGTDQIVGILKSMKDDMEKSIASLKASEVEAVKGYGELKAAKEKEIEAASESIEAKTKRVGELAVSTVQAQDGMEDALAEAADAEKFLATMDTQCATKEKAYAETSKVRAEEVSAISEAINILNDDDALDVFKKAVPEALLQRSAHGAKTHRMGFLQATTGSHTHLAKAEAIISGLAQKYHLTKLNLISYAMKSQLKSKALNQGAVDFGAITKMIDEMVGVLEAESKDDEKHKVWCTGEFEKSADEEAATQGKIDSLGSAISETADEIATTAEDIKTLKDGIAGLDKDVAEASLQRKAEHAEYLETVALTETAIQLIAKAKNRLQKFYNPALYKAPPKVELSSEDKIISNLGFVQLNRHTRSRVVFPEAPQAFAQYEKKTEKSGGVMALMDMLSSELTSSMKEAEFAEKDGQKGYSELMSDAQATRASDIKSVTDKASAKAGMESKLVELKEGKAISVEQLANVGAYISDLHGSCDFILANFALRLEARTSEIEGLKNAKAVLAGASYSL